MVFCVAHMWMRVPRHRLVSTGLAAFWNDTTPSILCANNQSKRSTERTHKTSIQIALSRHYSKSSKHTTSSEPHSELPTVPLSIRSLKRQANELWEYSDPTSPTFRQSLHTYLTGSFTQAHTGAQLADDLARTEASQQARKAWRTASHRLVQKGGRLYS